MAPIANDIREITAEYDGEPYWAGNGRDLPSVIDHNGFDCSGWDHFLGVKLAERGHYAGHYPVPLGSTSTYTKLARGERWEIPLFTATAGDTVIYAAGGDPEDSDGKFGHVGRVVAVEMRDGVLWALTSESRGGQGVGLYWRRLDWWTIAYRIPDPTSEEDFMATLTDDEKHQLLAFVHDLHEVLEPLRVALTKIDDIHAIAGGIRDGFVNAGEATVEQLKTKIRVLRKNVWVAAKATAPKAAAADG